MKNKILLVLVGLVLASMTYAQSSGGEIKRKTTQKTIRGGVTKRNHSSGRSKRNNSSSTVRSKSYSAEEMYEKGYEYEEKEDYKNAFIWYMKSAEQGYMDAQSEVGFYYLEGTGVDKNPSEAAKWLLKAANQGESLAQEALSNMYKDGIGVGVNEKEAEIWKNKAAKNFYEGAYNNIYSNSDVAVFLFEKVIKMQSIPYSVWALFQLGAMYFYGDGGLNVDYESAFNCFKIASDCGNKPAMYYLGLCYEKGLGTQKDPSKAIIYRNLSGYTSMPSRNF